MILVSKVALVFLVWVASIAPTFAKCVELDAVLAKQRLDLFVNETKLRRENVHADKNSGTSHIGIFQGQYEGHEVVIKKMNTDPGIDILKYVSPKTILSEVVFSKVLSEAGVAPRFFGVMKFQDSSYGLVTKKISPSWTIRRSQEPDSEIGVAAHNADQAVVDGWKRRLVEIVSTLNKLGVVALDMQFLLTPKGEAYVYDFGGYTDGTPELSARINNNALREFLKFLDDARR